MTDSTVHLLLIIAIICIWMLNQAQAYEIKTLKKLNDWQVDYLLHQWEKDVKDCDKNNYKPPIDLFKK